MGLTPAPALTATGVDHVHDLPLMAVVGSLPSEPPRSITGKEPSFSGGRTSFTTVIVWSDVGWVSSSVEVGVVMLYYGDRILPAPTPGLEPFLTPSRMLSMTGFE
jgi:hypothetical protein